MIAFALMNSGAPVKLNSEQMDPQKMTIQVEGNVTLTLPWPGIDEDEKKPRKKSGASGSRSIKKVERECVWCHEKYVGDPRSKYCSDEHRELKRRQDPLHASE